MGAVLDAGRERLGSFSIWSLALLFAAVLGLGSVSSPLLGVAVVGAVLFVVVVFVDLAAGLCLFTILTFFERFPGLDARSLTLVKAAGAVMALAWLLAVLSRRDPAAPLLLRDHPLIGWSAVAFVAWATASVVWAEDVGAAVSSAFRLIQGVLLVFIVYSALSEARHLQWFSWAFCSGAFITAIIGLAGFTAPEAHSVFESARVTGGIGDANELAAILIPALALVAFGISTTRAPFLRWLQLVFAATYFVALVRAESRGGLLGVAAMFLAAIMLGGPVRPRLVAIVGTVVALAVSYYTFVAPPEVLHRITNYSAGAASGRSDLWRIAADVAGDHPVVGVGAGNFQVVEPRYAVGNSNITRIDLIVDAPRVVHNTYLNLLVDFGAVGLAAFLLFAGGALACAWRAIRRFARYRLRDAELIGRGLLVGTVGMLASAVFLSAEYEKQLWLLFGVATALTRVATRAGGTSRALG